MNSLFDSIEVNLENKYSDSKFYRPENSLYKTNNYNYLNNYYQ